MRLPPSQKRGPKKASQNHLQHHAIPATLPSPETIIGNQAVNHSVTLGLYHDVHLRGGQSLKSYAT